MAEAASSLSPDAQALLQRLGMRKEAGLLQGLGRFRAPRAAFGPIHLVLRLGASKLQWGHAGIKVRLSHAVLEMNGLPVARVQLSTCKPHKKGRRFEGATRLVVRFDHASAAKEGLVASDGLSKASESAQGSMQVPPAGR